MRLLRQRATPPHRERFLRLSAGMHTSDPLPSNRVGAAMAAIGVAVFAAAAWTAGLPEVIGWDVETIAAFAGLGGEALVRTSLEVTALANGLVVLLVAALAGLLLFSRGLRTGPIFLLIAVPFSIVLNHGLKGLIGRPRPEAVEWLTHAGVHAFPSGHALYAVAGYGAVALAILPVLRSGRALLVTCWIFLALAVGASRIHLGVHHPTDVIGGYGAGLAWLGLALLLVRVVHTPELRVHRNDSR